MRIDLYTKMILTLVALLHYKVHELGKDHDRDHGR
jgi:hypothetical protein